MLRASVHGLPEKRPAGSIKTGWILAEAFHNLAWTTRFMLESAISIVRFTSKLALVIESVTIAETFQHLGLFTRVSLHFRGPIQQIGP